MKATSAGGSLLTIEDCYIEIPIGDVVKTIYLNNLPEITIAKTSQFNDEVVQGRATPIKTYSHSDNKVITMQLHLISNSANEMRNNIENLRALESALYPRSGLGMNLAYRPPPVCFIKCGEIFGKSGICVLLTSFSARMPTDLVWDRTTLLPRKVDVDLQWHAVYKPNNLPNQEKIFKGEF